MVKCCNISDWRNYYHEIKYIYIKNSTSLYVIKSIYENGRHSTKIVEKLGTVKELEEKLNGEDPIEWAKKYIEELNKKDKENKQDIIVKYSPAKTIEKDVQCLFNGGYLFIQQIYYALGLHKISEEISKKYKFIFDLNSILSRLIYGRILFPASKLATNQLSEKFIERPNFELQHIYRGLEVIAKEADFIQSELYKNSLQVSKRNTDILYYDCTNFFFEIEECFRIMKSEFKARPVYLSRDDRIIAHFITCFISLIIYRILEKKLEEKYTCHEILKKLKEMDFYEIKGEGYVPTYIRDDLTDDLHKAFGFRTDYQIVSKKQMKNIFKVTKK